MLDRPVVSVAQNKPERFGRYVLLDRIGEGGMAEVFRAVMPGAEGFRRTCVVKRILAHHAGTENFVEMFVREARICGLLNHPGIVHVFDFGQVGGSYFLAMEYVRGRDLQAVMRRLRRAGRPFPLPIAAFIAREVAGSLGYAHELTGPDGGPLNVIHRDVSPSNVMCLLAGGVKLLDFGIAASFGVSAADRTETGAFAGKYAYTAPERLRRQPIDGRSDLFSLGVVLWEMLTGQRLFRAGTDPETIRNVLEAHIPPPSSVRADVPAELDAVVMRALQRDPAARYPRGQAMADDLEGVLGQVRYHSKMLPELLHVLFGKGLRSGPVALSPDLLEETRGSITPPAEATPPAPGAQGPSPRRWRRLAAVAGALAATAALGAMLLARGGGQPSHAMVFALRPPALPAVVPIAPAPAGAATLPDEARPPIGDERAAGPAGTEQPAAPPRALERTPARRSSLRAERRRISRGLSIDPFADAVAGGQ